MYGLLGRAAAVAAGAAGAAAAARARASVYAGRAPVARVYVYAACASGSRHCFLMQALVLPAAATYGPAPLSRPPGPPGPPGPAEGRGRELRRERAELYSDGERPGGADGGEEEEIGVGYMGEMVVCDR